MVIDQASVSRRRAAVYCVVELSVALRAQQGWLTCCFTSTETVGLFGAGAQDVLLDFHTAPELCYVLFYCVVFKLHDYVFIHQDSVRLTP